MENSGVGSGKIRFVVRLVRSTFISCYARVRTFLPVFHLVVNCSSTHPGVYCALPSSQA